MVNRKQSLLVRLTESARRLKAVVYPAEFLLYYPAFLLLHSVIGTTAVILALIPAITVAGLVNKWAGFIVGVGMLLPNYLILQQLGSMGPNTVDLVGLIVAQITLGAIGYVYGDLYQVRHELAKELAERHSSDTKFRGLFESTRDAVMIADLDLVIRDANDEALRMLGYPRHELIGKAFIDIVPAEEHGEMQARAKQAVAGVRLPIYERTYVRKDGSKIVVEVSSALIHNTDGTPAHFQTIGRDVTQRKAAERELYYRATHDQLTGLFNRAMFIELVNRGLERSRRDKKLMAILFIDLDKFKSVNDTHGHLVGDMLLRGCASRLTGLLRKSDAIARIGGDEFAVMVEPIDEKKYAEKVAKNIQAALGTPITIEGKLLDIGTSVGISFFPDDATDAEALMGKADQLMYGVKQDSRRSGG